MARVLYSNPPAHGALVIAHILETPALYQLWTEELATMRQRIAQMRMMLVSALEKAMPAHDFSFMQHQHGMFSFSGLTEDQVAQLRDEFSVYMVSSGRISIAGLNQQNMRHFVEAMSVVLKAKTV